MRLALALAAALSLSFAATSPADAGHRGHGFHGGAAAKGHFGHHRRHRGRHRRHGHGHGAVVAGAILGGLAVAYLLTRPGPDGYARPAPARVSRAPTPPPGLGDCRSTTGTRVTESGRRVLMAGTWCTDAEGRGYILDDSFHFVRYLD